MKNYEIWIGYFNAGMDGGESNGPQLIGHEFGINFQVACCKYNLKSMLRSIQEQELKGYVQHQSMEWFYNRVTNSSGWIGKYYESQEDALKSFNNKRKCV